MVCQHDCRMRIHGGKRLHVPNRPNHDARAALFELKQLAKLRPTRLSQTDDCFRGAFLSQSFKKFEPLTLDAALVHLLGLESEPLAIVIRPLLYRRLRNRIEVRVKHPRAGTPQRTPAESLRIRRRLTQGSRDLSFAPGHRASRPRAVVGARLATIPRTCLATEGILLVLPVQPTVDRFRRFPGRPVLSRFSLSDPSSIAMNHSPPNGSPHPTCLQRRSRRCSCASSGRLIPLPPLVGLPQLPP